VLGDAVQRVAGDGEDVGGRDRGHARLSLGDVGRNAKVLDRDKVVMTDTAEQARLDDAATRTTAASTT
jgi:hypothetical protein